MFGRKYAGTVLVILGAVFLLGSITGMDLSLWKWWPALLIAAGLVSLRNGNWKGGLIVIAVFSALLFHNLGYFIIDFSTLWPVLIIAIGLALLFGRRRPSLESRSPMSASR